MIIETVKIKGFEEKIESCCGKFLACGKLYKTLEGARRSATRSLEAHVWRQNYQRQQSA